MAFAVRMRSTIARCLAFLRLRKQQVEVEITQTRMKLEDCLPAGEVHVIAGMVGRRIRGVWYETSGDVESAYLELDGLIVELAGIYTTSAGRITASVCPSLACLPPLGAEMKDIGVVEAIDAYANASAHELMRLDVHLAGGNSLIAEWAGGDFVHTTLVGPKSN